MDSSKRLLSLSVSLAAVTALLGAPIAAEAQVCIAPGETQASFVALPLAGVGDNAPTEIEAGDFNHDGLVDVAVLNASSVEMFVGSAGGADFTSIAIFGITDPRDLIIADFNHTGYDDVAVADESGAVRIAFNSGGIFLGLTNFPVAGPIALAAGDFDDDGHIDLAVADNVTTVAILRGDGLGGFTGIGSVTMQVELDMVAADVNRDARLDLIATNATGDRVLVAEGRGDGSFNPPVASGAGAGATSLITGDFDRDGFLDVVTVDKSDQGVSFLRGNGTTSFGAPRPYLIGGLFNRVNQGDFDRDGAPDLLLNDDASSFFYVLQNDGTGDFLFPPAVFTADSENFDSIVADLNGDGRQDVAMTLDQADAIEIQWNDLGSPCPNPSFAWTSRFHDTSPFAAPNIVTTAHLTVPGAGLIDAKPDFITGNPGANEFAVSAGFGNGDFDLPIAEFLPTDPISIATADMDADLDTDVVVAAQGGQIYVHYNNGSGGLGFSLNFPIPTPYQVALADVSFDGKMDIIVSLQSNDVLVGINDGTGGNFFFTPYAVGVSPGSLSVGDIDSDGLPDIAIAERNGNTIELLRNIGGGAFALAAPPVVLPASPIALKLAHLDFDGNLDIVVAYGLGAAGTVESFLGDGLFGFSFADQAGIGGSPGGRHSLAVADLDGDGNKDFAVTNLDLSRINIGLGDGAGGFPAQRFERTAEPAISLAVDDLDRDGTQDFLVTQDTLDRVQSFLNDGTGRFSPLLYPAPGGDARGSASADFDGDGKLDLVLANSGNHSVTFFRGTGGGGFGPGIDYSLGFGSFPVWVTAEDYDNDGDLDVVASASAGLQLMFLPWDGGGFDVPGITGSSLDMSERPDMHRAGDFNLDGNLDIAVVAPMGNRVQVLLGDGTGKFVYETSLFPGGIPTAVRVGDFNRDGLTDAAVTQSTDDILAVFHLTQITPVLSFTSVGPGAGVGPNPGDFDVTDIDGNGYLDFVVPATANRVSVVRDFLGGYAWDSTMLIGDQPRALRAVDMNRDGYEDLVVTDEFAHSLWLIPADGAGGFLAPIEMGVGVRGPFHLETADFDRDGRGDLAVVPNSAFFGGPTGIVIVLNTSCLPRLFIIEDEPSTCDFPPNPFLTQPRLRVVDDGANLIRCELRDVKAGLLGPSSLLGTTDVPPSLGIIQYTDLAVAFPGGRGLRLEYSHPEARRKVSDSFTQNPMVSITGPANLCSADPAIFSASPDFDLYTWQVDGGAPLMSMADTIDLTPLGVGPHTIDVTAEQDACFATDSFAVLVDPDLSSVTAGPAGPHTVCELCTGPQLNATPVGGGALLYQWGYRTMPGGAITPIGSETGPMYTIQGADFPGVGSYFVVVTVTPTCGSPIISNEIAVNIDNAATVTPLSAFTVLSTSNQNILELITPPGCDEVRILVQENGPFWDLPTDPGLLTPDIPCPAGNKIIFTHGGLNNGSKYFYTAFVEDVGMSTFSPGRKVTGRPFDTSGPAKWAFSTGYTSMTQAGIRIIGASASSVYVVTNDHRVYALEGGPAGGQSLINALPLIMGGPSQSWPPVVSFPIGGASNGAAFVSSQDGMIYVLDADDLSPEWMAVVGEPLLQAGAAATFFSANPSILLGTRNTVSPNVFQAYDPHTGAPLWTFDNSAGQGGDGSPIGVILGAASVNLGAELVYFGSHVGAGNHSLWAVDFSSGNPVLDSADNVGDLEASPVFLGGGQIVIGTKSGDVELRDANDVTVPIWSGPFNAGDGGIKGFVTPHTHAGNRNFMFSTASKITSIKDNGPGMAPTQNWQLDVGTSPSLQNPSIPLFLFGTTTAIVGTADGTVVQLNDVDTSTPTASTPVVLGDGMSAVGPPSFDIANFTIYVGTTEGVIYALIYPIP